MQNEPIRLFLVDDHRIVREGFALLFGLETDLHVVGQSASCSEALQQLAERRVDLLLLDLSLGSENGIDWIAKFAAELSGCRIVVLSSFGSDEDVFRAAQAGASGYFLKSLDSTQIITGIRAVWSGEQCFPDASAPGAGGELLLTRRERRIIDLIAAGRSNEEMASILHLAISTVKTHVYNVMKKLSAKNRTEAVFKARRADAGFLKSAHDR